MDVLRDFAVCGGWLLGLVWERDEYAASTDVEDHISLVVASKCNGSIQHRFLVGFHTHCRCSGKRVSTEMYERGWAWSEERSGTHSLRPFGSLGNYKFWPDPQVEDYPPKPKLKSGLKFRARV